MGHHRHSADDRGQGPEEEEAELAAMSLSGTGSTPDRRMSLERSLFNAVMNLKKQF